MTQPTALQVILTRELAGTERHVAELAAGLESRGWRSLIAMRQNASAEARRELQDSAELVELPEGPAAGLAPRIAAAARRERVDIINGHLGDGSAAALAAAKLAGVPVVSTVHFVVARHTQARTASLQRPLYRAMLRRMDAVIAVSDAVATAVARAVGPDGPPVRTVHNGVRDLPPRSPGGVRKRRPPVILCAGRLSAEKQVDLLLEAFAMLHSNTRLWVAGRGPEQPRLERLASRLAPGRVDMLGFATDVPRLMAQARVVAIPSRAEGFGLVAVEAMRAGVPVVGFAAGGLTEIVEDGVTGFLVEPGDVTAMTRALEHVVADGRLARRLGRSARTSYEARFTAGRMAEQTEAVYESVRRRRRATALPA